MFIFLLALICVLPTWALHESDVGVVDWHKHLVGVPLAGSISSAPIFHRFGSEGHTQSLLLTATLNNVLAALHPVNGSVAWRHVFEHEDRILLFHKHEHTVSTLSGLGGSILRSFDVLTGNLIFEKWLHKPEFGNLLEPGSFGKFLTNAGPGILALTNGHTVSYIHATTGELIWTWTSSDQSSLVIYSRVVVAPDAIYAVGVAKSLQSYTLHITALSPENGNILATADIPSSISDALVDFTTLSQTGADTIPARVVWLEQGSVKSITLSPNLKSRKPSAIKNAVYKQLVDVGLCEHGHLVGVKEDGSGRILKLQDDGMGLKTIWEFEGSATSADSTDSIYAGGFDKDGHAYISRVYWSNILKKATADVFTGHLAEGRGILTGFSFPFDTANHGIINHVAIDGANPSGWNVVSRLFITTSTGAVQFWQQDTLKWTREESLAALVLAEFVELSERVLSSTRLGEGPEAFFTRALRHLLDLQDLPQYLVRFTQRFATGSYASASSSASIKEDDGHLSRDTFGFRQVIVAATAFGKVYGIDSSNGEILWSRVLGLGWAAEVGGRIHPVKLFVTKTVSNGGSPEVVLVTQRRADNSLVDTVLFHLDALTGEDATKKSAKADILQGLDIIAGPLVEAHLVDEESKFIVLLDEFLQVNIYPDTEENRDAFANLAPSVHFPLRTTSAGQRRLAGHQVTLNDQVSDKFVAYPTWTLSLPAEEDIQTLIPSTRGPIASIGKVLGNRTTLYKYLNPRLFAVLTASHSVSPPTCGVYLVDGAKGSLVYHATIPANARACDVKMALTENWLVYHYYDDDFSATGQSKGYRMVTVELYEGQTDEKTRSSDMSAFAGEAMNVTTHEQSYVFPHAITAMSATSTKFGISSKDLIVATKDHKVQSIPGRMLNPRRPHRKTTTEEQEEFLIQYDPVIPSDPRRVLSHNYDVANVQQIVTTPALLESTSLVFAYGLDMFLTRVAPSSTFDVLSENFNKAQLVLTVSGLAVAIMITRPMVQRKKLREKWYQ
ncbi:hypothetical protein BD779DRAFT_1443085 [Infundibulicybe gibba]|nr:hypothetical protein BD779DRAFT_1443085 [Infundibulicybe gibba]